jgi:hypothetical protein
VSIPGDGMTQTFDIRFARSAGLAAMLEVPENVFRWKGGGKLRIDAHGISIGLRRGLRALLGGKHTQRIPTGSLRAVYREGDALRVEFQTGESARVVLPFWADDRETAARIVRLLPTRQTVEIEHTTNSTEPRADWRMLLWSGVALAAILVGSWAIYQRTYPPVVMAPVPVSDLATPVETSLSMPDATESLSDAPASPANTAAPPVVTPASAPTSAPVSNELPEFLQPPPVVLPALPPLPLPRDYVRSADFVIPIARGTAAYDIAKRELAVFEQEAFGLEAGYRVLRNLLNGGTITPEVFAAKLRDLEMRWWDLTFRIFDDEALADPALLDLRATMLGAARLWRSFLTSNSQGMLERDHVMIASSFDELARAQEMQSRARLFLR